VHLFGSTTTNLNGTRVVDNPTIEATLTQKQAEFDAAEQELESRTGTFDGQMTAKLHRVGKLQREVAELAAKRQFTSPQYQTFRSLSDRHVHLICREGEFVDLPDHIRHQGPWQAIGRGAIAYLKLEHRSAVEGDGYLLERCEPSSWA
jgi:hypothetical protein